MLLLQLLPRLLRQLQISHTDLQNVAIHTDDALDTYRHTYIHIYTHTHACSCTHICAYTSIHQCTDKYTHIRFLNASSWPGCVVVFFIDCSYRQSTTITMDGVYASLIQHAQSALSAGMLCAYLVAMKIFHSKRTKLSPWLVSSPSEEQTQNPSEERARDILGEHIPSGDGLISSSKVRPSLNLAQMLCWVYCSSSRKSDRVLRKVGEDST